MLLRNWHIDEFSGLNIDWPIPTATALALVCSNPNKQRAMSDIVPLGRGGNLWIFGRDDWDAAASNNVSTNQIR
jgi:hypothetical protein